MRIKRLEKLKMDIAELFPKETLTVLDGKKKTALIYFAGSLKKNKKFLRQLVDKLNLKRYTIREIVQYDTLKFKTADRTIEFEVRL